jgi:MFS family permease
MGLPSYRAMVADVTAPNERGRAYAAMGTAYSSGLLLGPALGGFLVGLVGRDALFLLTAAIEAGLAVGVILLLRGVARPATPLGDGTRVPLAALLTRPLLGAFLLAFIGHFPMGFIESIWALYVLDRGGSELVVGISFSAIAISKLVLQPWGGRLADRGDQTRLLLAGFLVMALAIVAYGLMPWAAGIVVIGFIEGAAAALAFPALDAYLASKADPRIQGRVQGTFSSLMMAGATVSAVGGALLYSVSPGLPFVVGGMAMGMLTCVAFVLIRGVVPGYPAPQPAWSEMSEGLQQ